eukprot:m.92084 g.92084  ORF g.92084 m.92084 type:complete len:252 (+) comp20218_c0_seq3:285-1040(+)
MAYPQMGVSKGGTPYVPTKDEQRVLDGCVNSAMFRGGAYGGVSFIVSYGVFRGKGGARMQLWQSAVVGLMSVTSFAVGVLSYSSRCIDQLAALEGSPMGEDLRKMLEKQKAAADHKSNQHGNGVTQPGGPRSGLPGHTPVAPGTRSGGFEAVSVPQQAQKDLDGWNQGMMQSESSVPAGTAVTSTPSKAPPATPLIDAEGVMAFPENTHQTELPSFFTDTESTKVPRKMTYEEIRQRNRLLEERKEEQIKD